MQDVVQTMHSNFESSMQELIKERDVFGLGGGFVLHSDYKVNLLIESKVLT